MTAEAGAIDEQREVSPWRAVGLFVLLTACLSDIFWVLINATQTPNPGYIWLLMWMPGVSALLTCRILRRPLSSLGWSWNWRWVLIGYLIPVAYCLLASLVIWIAGIGGFPNTDFVHKAAALLGLGGAPDWVIIAMFVVLQGTTGMISGVGAALGEEIGWRGFLVPELAKALPFTGVALVSGMIWASWHYPITSVVYRDADVPAWFWIPTFTVSAIAVSFVLAWLRLKTGSLWPGVFLHASHNLWMQSIFSPLTTEKAYTKWIAGDLGIGLVIVATAVGVVFWLKRGELPAKQAGPQPVA
jgi:membrane protease YdiL (CAAX protease family)